MDNDEIREALRNLHVLADKSQQTRWTCRALIWINDLETERFDPDRVTKLCQRALEASPKEAPLEEALERLQEANHGDQACQLSEANFMEQAIQSSPRWPTRKWNTEGNAAESA